MLQREATGAEMTPSSPPTLPQYSHRTHTPGQLCWLLLPRGAQPPDLTTDGAEGPPEPARCRLTPLCLLTPSPSECNPTAWGSFLLLQDLGTE